MRSWLDWLALVGVGVSASLMLMLLGFQAAYTGGGEPLRALAERDVLHAMGLTFYSATVATLVPGASFHRRREVYAPARALIDGGAAVALAATGRGGTARRTSLSSPGRVHRFTIVVTWCILKA